MVTPPPGSNTAQLGEAFCTSGGVAEPPERGSAPAASRRCRLPPPPSNPLALSVGGYDLGGERDACDDARGEGAWGRPGDGHDNSERRRFVA